VRPETRAKVLVAIEELGFVRNEPARQLRSGGSRMLAYVVLDAGNPFFTDVARGIDEVARDAGFALFLCNSDQDQAREDEYLDQLLQQRVHGALITAVDYANPKLRALRALGVPVVLVDRAPQLSGDWCSVGVDDVQGGDLAITHLLRQGHHRVAFVGGPLSIVQVSDRMVGCRRGIARAGLPEHTLVTVVTETLNVAEGRRAGEWLGGLPANRRPSAAVCANDLLALGLLQEMTSRGISVPHQMAIVGYDDIEFAGAAAVPLTSVSQPRVSIGRSAAQLLLKEAEAGSEHSHQHIQFPPKLIVRASSSIPRTSTQPGPKASSASR
jgi:LacI family transcriptional regulator